MYTKLLIVNIIFGASFLSLSYAQSVTSISDRDLETFSEDLLKKDNSGLSSHVTYDKQGKTNAASAIDRAAKPLLNVDKKALQHPTVAALLALFDNYDPDVKNAEVVTNAEKTEESKFLDAIMGTPAMNFTYNYAKQKGLFNEDRQAFKEWLAKTWFTLYSRGFRTKSSSAFEHVFLGELKQNQVSGLHNWLFFNEQEKKNNLNYMGWMRFEDFGKGSLLKLHYTWKNVDKPVGTLFVGTSPELELSLYSICYLARAGEKCNFKLNGKPLFIQSYTFTGPKSQKLIGSIYPGV
ncbi:poly(U)-specific endoribonuclease homolog [Nilaparvata lugens]|uniref:poly(U)-specific endoribonuclease homolog n=1 Tax=Nilaparvata lugens TaxID=108931 RepID=UPI000B99D055|nr:poly(U)-specific endoribonuclease homolog [Nilaparvata lugens]